MARVLARPTRPLVLGPPKCRSSRQTLLTKSLAVGVGLGYKRLGHRLGTVQENFSDRQGKFPVKWAATEVGDFLERLRELGRYASVAEMAREFGLSESTPRKWPAAQRRTAPAAFRDFLVRYAKRHDLDADALQQRWEIRRQERTVPRTEADELQRAVTLLRTNGRTELVEHLERQAQYLSMIPMLAAQVESLSAELRELRAQVEGRDVHESLRRSRADNKSETATGPPRKKARGR